MRPGQNKRMRGRNNRKGPNPLTRTYESNGPDVKIRGTAHHVAEKYLQLARDAQSSGDPVMAESYLQHAEHYFRLIASAQQAQQQAQIGYVRQPGDPDPEEVDDDDDGGLPDRFASPLERMQPAFNPQQPPPPYPQQGQPQPQPYGDRPQFSGDRQPQQDRPYQDRGPRPDRQFQDRNRNNNNNNQNRGPRDQRPPREFRNDQQPRFEPRPDTRAPAPPHAEDEIVTPGLPSFITAPVRVVAPEAITEQPSTEAPAPSIQEEGAEAGRFHLRNRRRRPRSAAAGEGEEMRPSESAAGDAPVAE